MRRTDGEAIATECSFARPEPVRDPRGSGAAHLLSESCPLTLSLSLSSSFYLKSASFRFCALALFVPRALSRITAAREIPAETRVATPRPVLTSAVPIGFKFRGARVPFPGKFCEILTRLTAISDIVDVSKFEDESRAVLSTRTMRYIAIIL